MKFEDLQFKPHPAFSGAPTFDATATQARHDFPNKYGVSIITGTNAYSSPPDAPYEVAIMHDGNIVYNTPLTEDVEVVAKRRSPQSKDMVCIAKIGHCNQARVQELLDAVEKLEGKK